MTPRQWRWEAHSPSREAAGRLQVDELVSPKAGPQPTSSTEATGPRPGPSAEEVTPSGASSDTSSDVSSDAPSDVARGVTQDEVEGAATEAVPKAAGEETTEEAAISTFSRARHAVFTARLRAMFSGWHALAAHLVDSRGRAAELAANKVQAALRAAFRDWRGSALAGLPSPQAKEMSKVAMTRVSTIRQRSALQWWKAAAAALARRRELFAKADRHADARRKHRQRQLLQRWGMVSGHLGAAREEAERRFVRASAARAHALVVYFFRSWRATVLTPGVRTLRAMAVEHAELATQRRARDALAMWSSRARHHLAARALNARVLERLFVRHPQLADVRGEMAEFMEVDGWFVRERVRTVRGAIVALRAWREAQRVPPQKVARIASLLSDARDKLRNIIREQHEETRAPPAADDATAVKMSGTAVVVPSAMGVAGVALPPEGVQLPTPRRESSPEGGSPDMGTMRRRFQDILDAPFSSEVQQVPIHWAGRYTEDGAEEGADKAGEGAALAPSAATAGKRPRARAAGSKTSARRSTGVATRRKRSASPKPQSTKKAAAVKGGKKVTRRTPSPARRTKAK